MASIGRAALCVAAVASALAGCLAPGSVVCADGRVCPTNSRCDDVAHRCVTVAEEMACAGHTDGDACKVADVDGVCQGSFCRPHHCGDGVRDPSEECDGTDLAGQTCLSRKFYGQTTGLACDSRTCKFITTGCAGTCGDGKINGGDGVEACDGADLGGADCRKAGFYDAAGLSCSTACTLDISGCRGKCGDGTVNGPEACDGAPPAGKTCLDFGYDQGLVGCNDRCQIALEGCTKYGWLAMPALPTTQPLSGVWASGPDDVFVVGPTNTIAPTAEDVIFHWDGKAWAAQPSGTHPPLFSVWGVGPKDVFAVGGSTGNPGTVVHWDGTRWSPLTSGLGAQLNGVWAAGPKDVFVAGLKIAAKAPGLVAHWDGATWSPTDASQSLWKIWGSGAKDVYAVGNAGLIVHWNGTGWSEQTIRSPNFDTSTPNFAGVGGSSPTDVYAVGTAQGPPGVRSAIVRFDGAAWGPIALDTAEAPAGVWSYGVNDFMTVGGAIGGSITRWTVEGWATSPAGPRPLRAVHGVPEAVFAVGTDATVLRWDRTAWSARHYGPVLTGVQAVWSATPDHAFAVTQAGTLLQSDGGGWAQMISNNAQPLFTVWGRSEKDVYAAGMAGTVLHWDGSAWTPMAPAAVPRALHGVWASGPGDVWAVGDAGAIVHWDGARWSLTTVSDGQDLRAVWGSGPGDVYAVGPSRVTGDDGVLHWNGTAWSKVVSSPVLLWSVWGTGANDVYAVGEQGTIVHWDGKVWETTKAPLGERLIGVGGTTAGDVLALGATALVHLRAGKWEPVGLPASLDPRGMSVSSSRIFVVGGAGEVHLDRGSVTCVGPERSCADGWDNDCDGRADAADLDCAGK